MGADAIVARKESSRIVGRRPLVRLAPARAFNPTRPINFPVIGALFTTRRLVPGETADHPRPRCLGERAQPPHGTHCCVYTARKPAVGAARLPRVGSTWPAGCPPLGGLWWAARPRPAAAASVVLPGGRRGQGGTTRARRGGRGAAAAVWRPSGALGAGLAECLRPALARHENSV